MRYSTSETYPYSPHTALGIKFSELLFRWLQRRHQRIALGHLEDRLLKDIGISRGEAEQEAILDKIDRQRYTILSPREANPTFCESTYLLE